MGRFGICDLFLQLYPCNPLYIIKNGNGNPLYIEVLMGNDGENHQTKRHFPANHV